MSGGIAAAGLAMAAVGTLVSVSGQMQQASAAKAAANYQSEVAAGNQQVATQNAQYAAAEGEAQAGAQEQKTRTQEGEILAGQASSGVDVNSPTASAVRTSQGELGQLDAQTIKSNAARSAFGYETQATNFGNAASAETAQGQNAETAGEIGAGAGLLSGVGNASLNYANAIGSASGLQSTIENNAYSINNTTAQGGNQAYDQIQNSPGF